MKTKLLFFSLLLGVTIQSYAQPAVNPSALPYYEGFAYPTGGPLIGQGNWVISGSSTIDETIQDDNLLYTGLAAPTGAALNYRGGGSDPVSFFTPLTEGTVYFSLLVRINEGTTDWYTPAVDAAGKEFVSLGLINSSGTGTNYGSCIMVKRDDASNTINFGYNIDSQTVNSVWDTTPITIGQTYLIVTSFTFGSTPEGKMWINPVVSGTEPTPTITSTMFTNNRSTLDRIFVRQDSNAKTPDLTLDEMRVATNWSEVLGLSLGLQDNQLASKVTLYPNPVQNTLNISSNEITLDSLAIYSVEGKEVLSQNKITNNSIDVSGLSSGMYVVKMKSNDNVITKKMVIE